MSARLQGEVCNGRRHFCGSAARPRRSTYITWLGCLVLLLSCFLLLRHVPDHLLPSATLARDARRKRRAFQRGDRIVTGLISLSREDAHAARPMARGLSAQAPDAADRSSSCVN